MKVLTDYLMTLGWAVVGAIAMAIALVLLVRVFTWLTPIDEWAELRQGNVAVAIVVGAIAMAIALVVAAAIPSPSLPR
jgi:putative membrane protein